jgi:hypothetical protein
MASIGAVSGAEGAVAAGEGDVVVSDGVASGAACVVSDGAAGGTGATCSTGGEIGDGASWALRGAANAVTTIRTVAVARAHDLKPRPAGTVVEHVVMVRVGPLA